MKNQNYSHIIWDWNGTLLDDIDCGIEAVNQMLSKRGLKTMAGKKEYFKAFTFPVIEYYKRLGFDFEKEPFEDLSVEYIDNYIKNFNSFGKLHENAFDVLQAIYKSNLSQVIISASEQQILNDQVNLFGIAKFFNQILGIDNIYASGKIDIAKAYIKNNKAKRPLLIGDTLHDYEVSLSIGADCILIPNGHCDRKTLMTADAVLLDNISQIPDYIGI